MESGTLKNSQIKEYLKTLKDGLYTLEIKRAGIRTTDQNNYYWQLLSLSSIESGYYPEELHYILKAKYMIQTTTDLDTKEFTDYIEFVKIFASMEFGIYLPDPE